MYEVVEHVERRDRPGTPAETRYLGRFATAAEALVQGRVAWKAFESSGSDDYAWWVVKREGADLAEWIADSRSSKEYVVDLTSGELVEIP